MILDLKLPGMSVTQNKETMTNVLISNLYIYLGRQSLLHSHSWPSWASWVFCFRLLWSFRFKLIREGIRILWQKIHIFIVWNIFIGDSIDHHIYHPIRDNFLLFEPQWFKNSGLFCPTVVVSRMWYVWLSNVGIFPDGNLVVHSPNVLNKSFFFAGG